MTQSCFKLPARLMASFLALAAPAAGYAAPSEAEILAALKRTPRIEETAKGQEILKEIMRASAFVKDTRRIQINQDLGKGTTYDAQDIKNNCVYTERHAGKAGFELRRVFIDPLLLFDKPSSSPVDTTTRHTVALGQATTLETFLGAVLQEADEACGRTGDPLPPDVATKIKTAEAAAAKGEMDQAQNILGKMISRAEQTPIGNNLYDTHQQVEAHEAIKLLGRWTMNDGFMTDKDHKSWQPMEEEMRQPQRIVVKVRALLDMKN